MVTNVPSTSFSVKTVPFPPGVQAQGPDILGVAEAVAFSPSDAVLAVGYDDGSVAIFRIASDNTYAASPRRRGGRNAFAEPRGGEEHEHEDAHEEEDHGGGGGGVSLSGSLLTQHLRLRHGHGRGLSHLPQSHEPLYPTGEAGDISLVLFRRYVYVASARAFTIPHRHGTLTHRRSRFVSVCVSCLPGCRWPRWASRSGTWAPS